MRTKKKKLGISLQSETAVILCYRKNKQKAKTPIDEKYVHFYLYINDCLSFCFRDGDDDSSEVELISCNLYIGLLVCQQ